MLRVCSQPLTHNISWLQVTRSASNNVGTFWPIIYSKHILILRLASIDLLVSLHHNSWTRASIFPSSVLPAWALHQWPCTNGPADASLYHHFSAVILWLILIGYTIPQPRNMGIESQLSQCGQTRLPDWMGRIFFFSVWGTIPGDFYLQDCSSPLHDFF